MGQEGTDKVSSKGAGNATWHDGAGPGGGLGRRPGSAGGRCGCGIGARHALGPCGRRSRRRGLLHASGAYCSEAGHSVEYQIDWGDGSDPSAWLAEEEPALHTYGKAGLYQVTATARCPVDQELSEPSSPVEIEVLGLADEAISAPAESGWSAAYWVALEFSIHPPMRPEGPSCGAAGLSYAYTAWGAVADCGDTPEYQFDWGDGTTSVWCDGQASHAFASGGTYDISARARCPVHGITSAYFAPLQVVMEADSGA